MAEHKRSKTPKKKPAVTVVRQEEVDLHINPDEDDLGLDKVERGKSINAKAKSRTARPILVNKNKDGRTNESRSRSKSKSESSSSSLSPVKRQRKKDETGTPARKKQSVAGRLLSMTT